MKMKCPHCGVSGDAPQLPSNRLLKCPRCTEIFLLPETDAVPEPPVFLEEEVSLEPEPPVFPEEEVSLEPEQSVFPEEEVSLEPEQPVFPEEEASLEPVPPVSPVDQQSAEEDILGGFGDSEPLSDSPFDTPVFPDEAAGVPAGESLGSETLDMAGDTAEEIMQDIASEIDAEDTSEGLRIPMEDEPVDPAEWTQQFDEATEPLTAGDGAVEDDTEGKEEVIGEEFFEFDNASQEDFLEIDTPESEPSSGESTDELQEYPDFSEEKITWKQEEDEQTLEIDEESVAQPGEDEIQADLKELLTTTCIACDNKVEGDSLYCQDCIDKRGNDAESVVSAGAAAVAAAAQPEDSPQRTGKKKKEIPAYSLGSEFSVGAVLKEASILTRGAKGAIWGGLIVMYLVVFVLAAGGYFLIEIFGASPDTQMVGLGGNAVLELANTIFSILFTAGLMNIGVRRVAGKDFSWKTTFSGFAKFGKVVIAGLLMTIMLGIGFLLLVLPGIYLLVGYSLALPLILDRNYGVWEAMEGSRKAIHKKWWKVFGLYLIMYLIFLVSLIPLGLGMIWTVPMFFVLAGVLYRMLLPDAGAASG
jgi:hypothetical protein